MRRRTSKWDVAVEPQQLSIRQTDEPPMKANDSANEFVSKSELNYSIVEENRESFSLPSEMKNEPTMMNKENDEADKLTELSHIPKTKFQSLRIPKLSDLDANQNREGDNFGRVREGWDKGLERNYGKSLSPGRNAWRQLSPTSPKRSWSRTHRSRSRSRSGSWGRSRSRSRSRSPSYGLRRGPDRYRSRSPPYGSRRGPEKWGVRGRTGGGPPVPCRDYAAGRCERGNDCRFLHDDNGRCQPSRYYDNTTSDAREIRGDRGRISDSRELSDYPRERFSSRNDRPPPICYDFTKGHCQRGSSCRYPHHDASHDVRSRAHDEEPPRRAGRDTPCKFFADGQCRRGEACRFSHHVVGPHENSNSSWNDLNQSDQTAIMDTSNSSSQWMGKNEDNPRVDDSRSIKPQLSQPQVSESNIYQNHLHVATQPIQLQNSTPPNVQIPQLVPPMSLNGQMQLFPLPQNAQQSQFMAPNITMQNLPILPPTQIGQTPQNYILPQLPHNVNLGGQIPQNLPLLAPLNGQIQPNFNFNGQNLNAVPQAPVSENLNLNEQPSLNSDTAITQKVVTSEQAAQIMNLSASLAQFFGSAQIAPGLVPVSQPNNLSGNMGQGNIDNNTLPPGFDQKDSIIEEAEAKNNTDDGNPPTKDVELEVKVEVSEAETADNKKEKGGDVDADVKADGEGKQSKDVKAMKMFKCALVEFVKDVLKPSWKEGHLSKEAHKTIVKKVVEKVTSATQSQSIPQTQDKIDLYFLHSKAKLTKLVQAYLEKYVKS